MPPRHAFRIGDLTLDVSAYELRRQERTVRVERRPMELLIWLVERRGELITREEIVDRLWGRDVFIDIDTSISTVIRKIRRALRDSADRPRFIQTVHGKGYRFIADVEPVGLSALVAVLPFENLQHDATHDYIADGLTEETIVELGRIDPVRLGVIGRTSSAALLRSTRTLGEIGRELGIDYVVEGSVRIADGRLRIVSTLVRVRDQVQVCTETYERDASNLLGLQAEIGRAIARQIHLRLSPQQSASIAHRQTENPDAYDLYLRGRYYQQQLTPATAARALDCFGRATAIDPAYALAWAGIADVYSSNLMSSDARPSDVSGPSRVAAARALKEGSRVPEAHHAVGSVHYIFDWDWEEAEGNFREALALDPNRVDSYWMLGEALTQQRRHDEALTAARRACELDPLNALSHSMSSHIAWCARDLSAAISHARDALLAEPDFWVGHLQLGRAHQREGRIDEALDAFGEASRLSNGNSKPVAMSACMLAILGRVAEARDLLSQLENLSRQRYVPPYAVGLIYAGLDDSASAFAWLEKAIEERDVHLIGLPFDSQWDRFRHLDRFQDLLRRFGPVATHRAGRMTV